MQSQPRHSERINPEPTALTLAVEGMSCGHCKVAITEEVTGVAGVESVDVSAIDEAGYDAVAP